jgi:hypothetical protein
MELLECAKDKTKFLTVDDYVEFCQRYLDFVEDGLQARIVAQNENSYLFFQYNDEGGYNITRPLNSNLMLSAENFSAAKINFLQTIDQLRNQSLPSAASRANFNCSIYSIQQAIGATLDALPAGMSNQARKVNGDLFERFIRLLIVELGIDCVSGTVQVPIKDAAGNELCKASYQHDLMLKQNGELKVIGSVKTSSKDRIDKVFLDKYLYSKLTECDLPHVAIFLNDVQRKKTRRENSYNVSSTFLPGHFKAYSIKLNALDGVYYCDVRPNMETDEFLASHIKTIDNFFCTDMRELLVRSGVILQNIRICEESELEDHEIR